MGTKPPIEPNPEESALARMIAMLRERAEAEREALEARGPAPDRAPAARTRRPILAVFILVLGGAIGWSLARSPVEHHEVLR